MTLFDPALDPDRITLDYDPPFFILELPYERRFIAKQAGFSWNPRRRQWVFESPFVPWIVNGLLTVEGVTLGSRCADWLASLSSYEQKVLASQANTIPDVPTRFPLEPYQIAGVHYIAKAGKAIIADEMGLGKTAQAICAADYVKAENPVAIVPKTLIPQWRTELEKFSLDPSRWIVTNYEAKDYPEPCDYVVFDEAVRLKNHKTIRTQKALSYARNCYYAVLLTGTPLRSRPSELFTLIHLLAGGTTHGLERAFWYFAYYYCHVRYNGFGNEVGQVRPEKEGEFGRMLAPRMIRRTKSLLSLPPLTSEVVVLEQTPEQLAFTQAATKDILASLTDIDEQKIPNILARMMRLRQIALSLKILPGYTGHSWSVKERYISEFVEAHPEDKILIFSEFASWCKMFATQLGYPYLIGEQSDRQRQDVLQEYQGEKNVLFASSQVGSVGLNLQQTTIVIWADLPWCPDTMEQGIARAWRKGTVHPVHEILLTCKGTIDEHIARVLTQKEKVITEVFAMREVWAKVKEDATK